MKKLKIAYMNELGLLTYRVRFLGSMLQLKYKKFRHFHSGDENSGFSKGSSRRGGGAHEGAFLESEALSPYSAYLLEMIGSNLRGAGV